MNYEQAQCATLLIAAPASGHGKTLITAALARHFRNRGVRTKVFKVGPDFLDPMILQYAIQTPVYNIDLWMVGKSQSQKLLYEAATNHDLILIESNMGLYDGNPSSADLARAFSIPVQFVVDAKGMAQSFGAIVKGFASYQNTVQINGVIANNVGSASHAQMIKNSIPNDIPFWGYIPRSNSISIPSRHLGLLQPSEIADVDQRIETARQIIEQQIDIVLPKSTHYTRPIQDNSIAGKPPLHGVRIGVAKDMAFSFIYAANIDLLNELGANIVYFSPIEDRNLPDVHSLWLPGGYPECFMEELSNNYDMGNAIREHFNKNLPIVAECGGMLYLSESLQDLSNNRVNMLGILPAQAIMQAGCVSIGLQTALLPEGSIRAHSFHHSQLNTLIKPSGYSEKRHSQTTGEAIYQMKRLTASYLHFYFPSNPVVVGALFHP